MFDDHAWQAAGARTAIVNNEGNATGNGGGGGDGGDGGDGRGVRHRPWRKGKFAYILQYFNYLGCIESQLTTSKN